MAEIMIICTAGISPLTPAFRLGLGKYTLAALALAEIVLAKAVAYFNFSNSGLKARSY